ncbi:hypothetical protein ACFL5A_02610 [Gemmatimonadota bacterium]
MSELRIVETRPFARLARVLGAYRFRARRLWIISPWISTVEDAREDPVSEIIAALFLQKCRVSVITRIPKMGWHERAIERLRDGLEATCYYANDLHTKLFLLSCDDMEYALLGSPNLTPRAEAVNKELAVEFRALRNGSDPHISLLRDLKTYAWELAAQDTTVLQPPRSRLKER